MFHVYVYEQLYAVIQHEVYGEGATPFSILLHFTLDTYLIMLSVKQGGIKYSFLNLWYDSTWDWTQVSRTIGEHLFVLFSMLQTCFSYYFSLNYSSLFWFNFVKEFYFDIKSVVIVTGCRQIAFVLCNFTCLVVVHWIIFNSHATMTINK